MGAGPRVAISTRQQPGKAGTLESDPWRGDAGRARFLGHLHRAARTRARLPFAPQPSR